MALISSLCGSTVCFIFFASPVYDVSDPLANLLIKGPVHELPTVVQDVSCASLAR